MLSREQQDSYKRKTGSLPSKSSIFFPYRNCLFECYFFWFFYFFLFLSVCTYLQQRKQHWGKKIKGEKILDSRYSTKNRPERPKTWSIPLTALRKTHKPFTTKEIKNIRLLRQQWQVRKRAPWRLTNATVLQTLTKAIMNQWHRLTKWVTQQDIRERLRTHDTDNTNYWGHLQRFFGRWTHDFRGPKWKTGEERGSDEATWTISTYTQKQTINN